jgi:hypothetical protein
VLNAAMTKNITHRQTQQLITPRVVQLMFSVVPCTASPNVTFKQFLQIPLLYMPRQIAKILAMLSYMPETASLGVVGGEMPLGHNQQLMSQIHLLTTNTEQ